MAVPLLIAAVVGYLLGALPFGWLVARRFGVNIFEHGSKNPGATNVKRVLGEKFGARGKRAGNVVFFLDALKGAVATGWPAGAAASGLWPLVSGLSVETGVAGLVGALVGHSFSCFTRFKGGKGVATAAGGMLVLAPLVILVGAVTWFVTFYTTRYVSLASMFAGVSLPIAAALFGRPPLIIGLTAALAVFVIVRHRSNIARLLAGTESRFARKPRP